MSQRPATADTQSACILPRAAALDLIAAATARAGDDPSRLAHVALVCDLVSRMEREEARDLVASVAALVLHGSDGGLPS